MPSQNSEQLENQKPEANKFNSWVELAKRSGMSDEEIAQIQANAVAAVQQRAQKNMLPADAARAQIEAELPQAPTAPVIEEPRLSQADEKILKEQGMRAFYAEKAREAGNKIPSGAAAIFGGANKRMGN